MFGIKKIDSLTLIISNHLKPIFLSVTDFDRFTKGNSPEQIGKKENEYYIARVPNIQSHPREHTKFIWCKDGSVITEDNRIQIGENGDLYLSNLKTFHRGKYKLTVENTFLSSEAKPYAIQDVIEFQMSIQGI